MREIARVDDVPQGIHQLKRIKEILAASNSELPDLVSEECRDLMEQIGEKTRMGKMIEQIWLRKTSSGL